MRVVDAMAGVATHQLNDRALIVLVQLTTELDDVYMPVHKRSHKERARWRQALNNQLLPSSIYTAVFRGDIATARAKRAAATILWAEGEELIEIERSLKTHYPSDYAGTIRNTAERTRDLLSPVARIAEIVSGEVEGRLSDLVDNLSVRLELGIPTVAVPIAQHVRRTLTRADYLTLINAGVVSPQAALDARGNELARLLDSKEKAEAIAHAANSLIEATGEQGDQPVLPPPTTPI